MNTTAVSSADAKDSSSYAIACGMLVQDWKLLLPLYCLLIAPQLVSAFIFAEDPEVALLFLLAGRVIDLLFLGIIGGIWLRRLSMKSVAFSVKPLVPIISVGTALWLLFMVPLAMQFSSMPAGIKFASLLLLVPAVTLNLRYFFFFVPLLLRLPTSKAVREMASSYTENDRLLALKVVFAPAAISILLSNILAGFSPDERSLTVNTLISIAAGTFWLLTTYLALAHAFLQLPESQWHAQGLDPYRKARLTTLALRAPQWFARLLTPKKAVTVLILSALIWAGNFLRMVSLPPSPAFRIESLETFDHSIAINLHAEDAEFQFRGFRPIFFALAGPQRGVVAKWPERVVTGDQDVRLSVPPADSAILRLEFLTTRTAQDLLHLEDLYLWYRNVKLLKLDMTKAKLIEAKGTSVAPANATP